MFTLQTSFKIKSVVEVTVNSKEENSEDVCLNYVQEFGLRSYCQPVFKQKSAEHIPVKKFEFLFENFKNLENHATKLGKHNIKKPFAFSKCHFLHARYICTCVINIITNIYPEPFFKADFAN
jgi:hypothetical protein